MSNMSGVEDSLQCPATHSPFINTHPISNSDTAMSEQKKCTKCKLTKPLTEFGINKQAKDGKSYSLFEEFRYHS